MPALQESKRSGLCWAHSMGLRAMAKADLARCGESVGRTNCFFGWLDRGGCVLAMGVCVCEERCA